MNFGQFSVQRKQKYFYYSFFYHFFIDILRLYKKLTEKIQNSQSYGNVGDPKKGCPDVHDFNPSGHLKQKSRTDS